jgi:hypothetical protein
VGVAKQVIHGVVDRETHFIAVLVERWPSRDDTVEIRARDTEQRGELPLRKEGSFERGAKTLEDHAALFFRKVGEGH